VSKSYTYDWAGRTKTIVGSSGTTTLNYDSAGRVSSIALPTGTSTFAYNGLSARVKRVDPTWGTRTLVRDGLAPGSDVLFDGAATYTPGVSDRGSLGDDRYYNGDGLGSVTDVTNASGALSAQRTFDAYGLIKSGPIASPLHGYHEDGNYEEDPYTGLKLCGYRYYDPSIGRFLSPDPAGVGSNWYDYCGNDPIGAEDPSGLRAYNMHDGADDFGSGSDNQTGWWDGNSLSFNVEDSLEGAATGLAGLGHGASLGLYGGGRFRSQPGFGFATGCGVVVDACAVAAGGSCVAGRISAQVAGRLAVAGGAAATQADKIEEEVQPFAMGLARNLDAFAAARGASTWEEFPMDNWQSGVLSKLADPNTIVHFNLDGVDVWNGASRGLANSGGPTDWELGQIYSNPQFWDTIRFWHGGVIVPNPFAK
jgi:RHS repeat-associated protein